MPSRCSNTLVIVSTHSVVHLVSRIIFVCCWLNYTANTLRFRAKRLDDGAEVVVGMSSFRSHVLGIDCGSQRKCLRRLVEIARAAQTYYKRHVAAVTPEIGRVGGIGESISLSLAHALLPSRLFRPTCGPLENHPTACPHTRQWQRAKPRHPPKTEMIIPFCYPSSSSQNCDCRAKRGRHKRSQVEEAADDKMEYPFLLNTAIFWSRARRPLSWKRPAHDSHAFNDTLP